MNKNDFDTIFQTDNEGRFINLIIPENGEFKELNLIGKKRLELSIDEVIRVKKYAHSLRNNSE